MKTSQLSILHSANKGFPLLAVFSLPLLPLLPLLLIDLPFGQETIPAPIMEFNGNTLDQWNLPDRPDEIADSSIVTGQVTRSTEQDYVNFFPDGRVQFQGTDLPTAAFTVESYFYLQEYSAKDPWIASILSAAYWDGAQTFGMGFRVGGGYNYPLAPGDAYQGDANYVKPQMSRYHKAMLSACIGFLGIGAKNSQAWKEVHTDRCLETKKWNHMVGTWNGEEMRVFLNGVDATDGWRINGFDLDANLLETYPIQIGGALSQDSRLLPFPGKVRFVNLYDQALSLKQIRERYKTITTPQNQCHVFVQVESPVAGEVVSEKTKVAVKLTAEGDCDQLPTLSEVSIALSLDPGFETILKQTNFGADSIDVALLLENLDLQDAQPLFWRFTYTQKKALAKRSQIHKDSQGSTGSTIMSSRIVPTVVHLNGPSAAVPSKKKSLRFFSKSEIEKFHTRLRDKQGRRVGPDAVKAGIYFIPGVSGGESRKVVVWE